MAAPKLAYCAQLGRISEEAGRQGAMNDSIDPATIECYRRLGRRLRAEAFAVLLGRLGRGLAMPVRALRDQQRKHRAIRDLRALPDRMLKDIGIGRSDITAVVEGLWGRPAQADNEYRVHEAPRPVVARSAPGLKQAA